MSNQKVLLLEHGVKPMVLIRLSSNYKGFLTNSFPYVRFGDGKAVMLFSSVDVFESFKKDSLLESSDFDNGGLIGLDINSIVDQKILGYYLGYPPKAVDWFVDSYNDNDLLSIDYHGIRFACSIDDKDTCIQWLLENRPVPTTLKTGITGYVKDENRKTVELFKLDL